MKCIILAGGYAKRMWPLTENQAKCLLPINERPMIDFIVEKTDKIEDVDEIIISTNAKFAEDFENYAESVKEKYNKHIVVVAEPTMSENEKLGAVGGIAFVIDSLQIKDDVLIINGDNLSGLKVDEFVGYFNKIKMSGNPVPVTAVYTEQDKDIIKRMSCVELDETGRVVSFEEKPKNPGSKHMSIGFYIFPVEMLDNFRKYLDMGQNKDTPGCFLQWLHKLEPVYGFVFDEYWYDIGSFEIYEKVQKIMQEK